MSIRCGDIVKAIEEWACPSLAEDWDNVGLHVGSPQQEVKRIMVALTPSEQTVTAAVEQKADMLVTHHPLLFKPAKAVTTQTAAGRSIYQLVQNNIALYCAHTSLDAALGGVNDVLAKALGLKNIQPMVASANQSTWYKLVVYVPAGFEEQVRQAICEAGAGQTEGHYDAATFRGEGIGTFRPLVGAAPFYGKQGELSQVREFRLETVVSADKCASVLKALMEIHPYEEVAYDLFKLEQPLQSAGLGRIGTLTQPLTLAQLMAYIAQTLSAESLTFCGESSKRIQTVALCGGSGSGFLQEAKNLGADVYITGDMKYHDGQLAEELGLAVIDAGHFATERLVLPAMADYLRRQLFLTPEQVWVWQGERDFLQHYQQGQSDQ